MSLARNQAAWVLGSCASSPRPKPVKQAPLPPWDASDPPPSNDIVHTTPPSNLVIPPGYDRGFWRGDIGGVMLPSASIPPIGGTEAQKIAFAQSIGANTTPLEMTMSFLLPHYVQFGTPVVDAFLTAHAQRGYSHFHLDRGTAVNVLGGIDQALDLLAYVQSWGFYTSFWLCGTGDDRSGGWPMLQPMIEPFLQRLIARGLADKSIALVGEELNSGCVPGNGPNGLDGIINGVCGLTNPVGIPTYLHFTANVPSWQPDGMNPVQWIAEFQGKLTGICSQLNPDDSAGAQGAHLWDTRWRWAAASLDYRVVAFEIMATAELYGQCSEEYGCLRNLELLYCPSGAPTPDAPAVAGCGNGSRYRDGTAI